MLEHDARKGTIINRIKALYFSFSVASIEREERKGLGENRILSCSNVDRIS